jgi:bifunctional non-homologous end joining protein LigD
MVPDIAPMLVGRGRPAGGLDGGWDVEPKLDGWRATVLAAGDEVVVRTRRGRRISVPGMEALAGLNVVLDDELVANAGTASDFYALGPSVAGWQRAGVSVAFMAFDVLWHDGDLLLERPYEDRRALLEGLALSGPCGVVPRFPGVDAEALLEVCAGHDVEGVVLKRRSSQYRPGERSKDWRKIKAPGWGAHHAQRRQPQ